MEPVQPNLKAAFLVKEEVLSKIMEARTITRQSLTREGGELLADNTSPGRHLLVRQGDGRYLDIRAITNDQVKEALADLAPRTKRLLSCEELRQQVVMLLEAEITGEDHGAYLRLNERWRP